MDVRDFHAVTISLVREVSGDSADHLDEVRCQAIRDEVVRLFQQT